MLLMDMPKRIKKEPVTDEEEQAKVPKQAASPAQEATRAHIFNLETQMKNLTKMKNEGKLDSKGAFQMRCVEDELRKAHSKLRRLLNEAERQRRRRERMKGCSITPAKPTPPADDGIMSALKSCSRFQDFVRELNVLGFSISPSHETTEIELNNLPEVEVELIEGEEEFAPIIKTECPSPSPAISFVETINGDIDDQNRPKGESYRQWFERQTEVQQRWEENFMREQMELTRSLLESVTNTFLQGIQQVISTLQAGRRFPPYYPDPPT